MARTISETTSSTTFLDTNIYNVITKDSSQSLTPSLGTKSKKSAGVVKLANMLLKLLFTVKGSNYLDKEEGTTFVRVFTMAMHSEDAVLVRIQAALDDAVTQIESNQASYDVPDTEKLKSAYVSSFGITENGNSKNFEAAITIEVASGDTTDVQLPSTLYIR